MIKKEHIIKEDVFKFFNYKWMRVPEWAESTEKIYREWYLKKYDFKSTKGFKNFLKSRTKCADMGAGLGRDVKFFRELASSLDITAVDQSAPALRTLKKNNPTIHTVKLDITISKEVLQILGRDFDFISCDQVLHHTPNPLAVLKTFSKMLKHDGVIHFFVCNKKNEFRDLADDVLMHHARYLSPKRLWQFAEVVTSLGKELHQIHEGKVRFKNRIYPSLQNYVHNNLFRCWYNPDISFELSVSSNYDWFSNNPRYSVEEVKSWMNQLEDSLEIVNLYSDDASVAVVARKI